MKIIEGILVLMAILLSIGGAIWWKRKQGSEEDRALAEGADGQNSFAVQSADATESEEVSDSLAPGSADTDVVEEHVLEVPEPAEAVIEPVVDQAFASTTPDSESEPEEIEVLSTNEAEATIAEATSEPEASASSEEEVEETPATESPQVASVAIEPETVAADPTEEPMVAPPQFDMPSVGTGSLGARFGSNLPPRKSERSDKVPPAQDTPSQDTDPAAAEAAFSQPVSDLKSRPIPPRRSRQRPTPSAAPQVPPTQVPPTQVPPTQVPPAQTPPPTALNDFVAPSEVASGASADAALQDEVAELRLQLEASQQELSHLTTARDQAMSFVKQSENRAENIQSQVSELEAHRATLQRERDALTKQVEELTSKSAGLETDLATAKLAAEDAIKKVNEQAENSDVVRELEAKHEATVNELRTFLGQREAAEASLARERDSLLEQSAELQRKLDALSEALPGDSPSEEIAQAAEANEDALARIGQLEQREHQISAELSLANETIRQLNQNLSQRDAKIVQVQSESRSIAEELATLKEDAAKAAEVKESETSEESPSEAELSLANETIRQLNQNLSQRDAQIFKLRKQHDEATTEISSLKQKFEELEAAPTPSNEAELSLANETIRQLNQNLTQRDAQILQLRKEHTASTTELAEWKEKANDKPASEDFVAKPDYERVVQELESARAEIETIQGQVEEAAKKVPDEASQSLAKLQSENDELRSSLTQLQAADKTKALQSELDAARTEIETIQGQVQEAAKKVPDEASQSLAKLQSENDELRSSLTQLQAADKTKALQSELDAARTEIETIQGQVEEAAKKVPDEASQSLAKLQSENDELRSSLTQLQAADKTKALQSELDAARTEIETIRGQIEEATKKVPDEASQSLAKLQSENDELRSNLTQLQAAEDNTDLDELRAQLNEFETSLQNSQLEKAALEDQVGAFQEEINAKSAAMRQMQEELKVAKSQAESATELGQANDELQSKRDEFEKLAEASNSELRRIQSEQIELKQQLAAYGELSEKWDTERLSLYAQLGWDENGEPLEATDTASSTEDAKVEVAKKLETENATLAQQVTQLEKQLGERNVAFGEMEKQFKQLQDMLENQSQEVDAESVLDGDVEDEMAKLTKERDRAATAAAEASATIARLMTENSDLRRSAPSANEQDAEQIEQLKAENNEFRRSVAELHAVANEFEEMKLVRSREQASARDRLQQAVAANAELSSEVASLKQQIEKAQTGKPDSADVDADLRTKIDELRAELEKREKKIAQLKKTQVKSATVKKKALTKSDNGKATAKSPAPKKRKPKVPKPQAKRKDSSNAPKLEKDKNVGFIYKKKPSAIDDLKEIVGVGPVIEKRLNSIGIYQFRQVSDWTKKNVEYLDDELSLGGRIDREKWIAQAKKLARKNR